MFTQFILYLWKIFDKFLKVWSRPRHYRFVWFHNNFQTNNEQVWRQLCTTPELKVFNCNPIQTISFPFLLSFFRLVVEKINSLPTYNHKSRATFILQFICSLCCRLVSFPLHISIYATHDSFECLSWEFLATMSLLLLVLLLLRVYVPNFHIVPTHIYVMPHRVEKRKKSEANEGKYKFV